MTTPFRSVVMAGGGSRCLWHAGFWREAAEPLGLAPAQIAAVSASSAIACALVVNRGEETLKLFQEAVRKNPRNVYLRHVFGPERVFPHERMYRRAILDLIDGPVLARIHAGPDIRVLLGRAPAWTGVRLGILAAALAYNFDKRVRKLVHPRAPLALGFRPEVVPVRACRTPAELADLILASSCTPPMTTLQRWNGRAVLDGGVVDNVPVCALDGEHGNTLVLLTRRYPAIPPVPGRTYVQPSRPIAVSAWDYTSAQGLQDAYDLGRRDGEAFVREERERVAASA